MDDKDRTIRQQQNRLEQFEKDKINANSIANDSTRNIIETTNCATQTERVNFLSTIYSIAISLIEFFFSIF